MPTLHTVYCVSDSGTTASYVLDGNAGRVELRHVAPPTKNGPPHGDPCPCCEHRERCLRECGGRIEGCPTAEAWAWAEQRYTEGVDAGGVEPATAPTPARPATCPAADCDPAGKRACAYEYCPAAAHHGLELQPCAACGAPCIPGEIDLDVRGQLRPICIPCSRRENPEIADAVLRRDAALAAGEDSPIERLDDCPPPSAEEQARREAEYRRECMRKIRRRKRADQGVGPPSLQKRRQPHKEQPAPLAVQQDLFGGESR
jgi:hypothetical protein